MSNQSNSKNADVDLEHLELQVEELIRTLTQLRNENVTLRSRQEDLMTERASLIDKTEQAKSRLEAMISRLKSLENKQ
ncbi:MAG: TIGR02449 family protein [Gammaproteobacteria bacterium]|nr:TIGR02449 family protein [Gammaproteobacteria bacterium]